MSLDETRILSAGRPAARPWRPDWPRAAFIAWGIYGATIAALVFAQKPEDSLIYFYQHAVWDFWNQRLEAPDYRLGFYYLPAARVLFTPFAAAGAVIGGVAWRLFGCACLTLAMVRWSAILAPGHAKAATALALAILIAPSAGGLHNGQFDAPTWALMALGAAFAAEGRSWSSAAVLGLALALKPTAIVAVLLLGAIAPALALRLVVAIAAVLATPFLNPHWDYVVRLYQSWLHDLVGALPVGGRFSDLFSALAVSGLHPPRWIVLASRSSAALAALGLSWLAVRRLDRRLAIFVVFALAALYLLLFNPRTEGSSYVGLALVAAPFAARLILLEGRPWLGWTIGVFACGLGALGVSALTLTLFQAWLRPLAALVFLVAIIAPRAMAPGLWTPRPAAAKPLSPPMVSA